MEEIIERLTNNSKTISTMESCTGGALANAITDVEGSSKVIKFSAVTYSNEFKIKMGVDKNIIDKYTVYSIETARQMSKNISKYAQSNYGIGITGQINRVDENNITSENNGIYISIYDRDNDRFYDKKIKAIDATRHENKEEIIKEVTEMLKTII